MANKDGVPRDSQREGLKVIVSKVGDSVAAVTKEIELQRSVTSRWLTPATRKADCQPA
jgi:hypothetical protein